MSWWSTLIHATPGVILTRSYGEEGSPEHSELIAFDANSGKRLWMRSGIILEEAGLSAISVRHLDQTVLLNIHTGEEVNIEMENAIEENKKLLLPFRYINDSTHFKTVSNYLLSTYAVQAMHVIEYLEYQGLIFISFYVQGEEHMNNRLLVIDDEGQEEFQVTLGENLKGISDNTFFLFNGNLIFVDNRNQFFNYLIS